MAAPRSLAKAKDHGIPSKRQAMKPNAQINFGMTEAPYSAFEAIPGALDSGALIICDHASNAIPPGYGTLGLPRGALERHIAYDIGAAEVTRVLAGVLGAPAVLSTYSRLVIDPNRGLDDPTLVMRYSDGAIVPGNTYIDSAEIARRSARFWAPYRQEVATTIDAMIATGEPPTLISIHSFTPVMRSLARPWKIGILWDQDGRIPKPLIDALIAEPDLRADEVGDNEPYDGALAGDTIDAIATARGLANALIEIRQDLIAEARNAIAWAERLARVLRPIIADRRSREPADLGSRAWATDHRRGKRSSAT
jgi:predicted N-formylglutamate amidohydrolase